MPRRGGARRARARRTAAAGRRRRRQRQRHRQWPVHNHTGRRAGRRTASGVTTVRGSPRNAVVGLLVFGVCVTCVGLVLMFSVSSSIGIGPLCIGGVMLFAALVTYVLNRNRPINRTIEATATEQVSIPITWTSGPNAVQPTGMVIGQGSSSVAYFSPSAPSPELADNGGYGGFAPYPPMEPYLPPPHSSPEAPPPSYEDVMK